MQLGLVKQLRGAAVIADRQQNAPEQGEQRGVGNPLRAEPRGETAVLAMQLRVRARCAVKERVKGESGMSVVDG
jgi:hypothetical protein